MDLLNLDRIGYSYPGSVRPACSDISLSLKAGQTLALMGENGAGKSTLASLVNGRLLPENGNISGEGADSVGLVHQRPHRVMGMPLWKVMAVGNRTGTGFWVKRESLKHRIAAIQKKIGSTLDLNRDHGSLTPSEAQEAELIEVLMGNPRVLILDEPDMNGLPSLKDLLELLHREERGIVLITHSLKEASELAENRIFLRDGAPVDEPRLFHRHPPGPAPEKPSSERRSPLTNLSIFCDPPLDLSLYRGDKLVVLGYKESGLEELEKRICAILENKDFAYIPSDSQKQAQDRVLSLQDNLKLSHKSFSRGWRNIRKERLEAVKQLEAGGWDFPPEAPLEVLSGGNRQRLLLQRECARPYPLLLAVHPTQGLDSLKKQAYMEAIRELKGKGVIYLTSEPGEALEAATVIAVYYRGKIRSLHSAPFPDEEELQHLMMGAGR